MKALIETDDDPAQISAQIAAVDEIDAQIAAAEAAGDLHAHHRRQADAAEAADAELADAFMNAPAGTGWEPPLIRHREYGGFRVALARAREPRLDWRQRNIQRQLRAMQAAMTLQDYEDMRDRFHRDARHARLRPWHAGVMQPPRRPAA